MHFAFSLFKIKTFHSKRLILGIIAGAFIFISLSFSQKFSKYDFSSSIQEKAIKRIDHLKLIKKGPNCWNGALIKAGLIDSIRLVSLSEYWFWMDSPFCSKVGINEPLQKGDLGSIFWKGIGHYHSFIYIDSDWVFSKNSPDPKHEYKIQKVEDMFSNQSRMSVKKCWNRTVQTNQSECQFHVEYHRCNPIDSAFFYEDKEMSLWMKKVTPLEEIVFQWVSGQGNVTIEDYSKVLVKLNDILFEIKSKKRVGLNQLKKFKLEALEYRLLGLILSDIDISRSNSNVYKIISSAYKIQKEKVLKTNKRS